MRNITNILKIKENFSKPSIKQIEELNKSIFNNSSKLKPKINMTTKGSFNKQVIVPMGSENSKKFISSSGNHVANLNHTLKNIKSETIVDFMHVNYRDLIITSNKIASLLDISVINRYIKSCNNIDTNDIQDTYVKNAKSGLSIFFYFLFLFSFRFIFLYSIFRTRVRVRVTRSCCHTAGHIR